MFDFPSSPAEGQIFNAPGGPSYVFNTPVWKAVGQGQIAIISDTPPPNPANGALWYESDSGVLYIWYNDGNSSQWVQVGGNIGGGAVRYDVAQGLSAAQQIQARSNISVGWEMIATAAVANVAALTFLNLGAFRLLRLTGKAVPATAGVGWNMRLSIDNGATYITSSSYNFTEVTANGATLAAAPASNTYLPLAPYAAITATAGNGISFAVDFFDFNVNNFATMFHSQTFYQTAAVANVRSWTGGGVGATSPRNAMQAYFSTGNIATAHYILEGVRG